MKFRYLILLLILPFLLPCTALAASEGTYVWDNANVLGSEDDIYYNEILKEISEELGYAIIFVTVNDEADYPTVGMLASDFFTQESGYTDGVILYLAFGTIDNDYHIEAFGSLVDIFSEDMYIDIENAFLPYLRSQNFRLAIGAYAEACQKEISSYGKLTLVHILLGLGLGALLSTLIPMNILKAQLKTVSHREEADHYMKTGSLKYTVQTEDFLNKEVSRVHRVSNSGNSHKYRSGGGGFRSSGGGFRGGGSRGGGGRSGKF